MSKAARGGRRTSDFGFPSARSTVGRRSGSPPKPRPSGLFGGDAAYNTANSPPVGRVPSHGDRFAESLRPACHNDSASGQVASDESAFRQKAGFWAQAPTPLPIPSVASPDTHRRFNFNLRCVSGEATEG